VPAALRVLERRENGRPHRLLLGVASDGVDAERTVEPDDDCCAACEEELREGEQSRPVCGECDRKLDRELAAYLSFVAVCRE